MYMYVGMHVYLYAQGEIQGVYRTAAGEGWNLPQTWKASKQILLTWSKVSGVSI